MAEYDDILDWFGDDDDDDEALREFFENTYYENFQDSNLESLEVAEDPCPCELNCSSICGCECDYCSCYGKDCGCEEATEWHESQDSLFSEELRSENRAWSHKLDEELLECYLGQSSIDAFASKHQISRQNIDSRLIFLCFAANGIPLKTGRGENSGKRWTPEEEILLKQLVEAQQDVNIIAKHFGRTALAIASRMVKNRIATPVNLKLMDSSSVSLMNDSWNESQIAVLNELLQKDLGIKQIATQLGKTPERVVLRLLEENRIQLDDLDILLRMIKNFTKRNENVDPF